MTVSSKSLSPAGAFVLPLVLIACGGSNPTPAPEPTSATGEKSVLAGGDVYDARGDTVKCEKPKSDCPDVPPNRSFLDQCKLHGYQVVQCACDLTCTGKVVKSEQYYDAQGSAKPCAPQASDCTPPETSAAFQDACTDHGHQLVICGCEWLCNGKLK